MFWVFSRDRDEIRLETSSDVSSTEFVVDVIRADGRHGTERFADQRQFWTWLLAMRRALAAHEWTLAGPFRTAKAGLPPIRATSAGGLAESNPIVQTWQRGDRTFRIAMSMKALLGISRWVIEEVTDLARAERVLVPGMSVVTTTSAEAAFKEACAHIEAWLSGS